MLLNQRRLWSPSLVSPMRAPPASIPIEINWSHPLARGLVALFIPGSSWGFRDLCGSGVTLTPSGGAAVRASAEGAGFNASPTGSWALSSAIVASQKPSTAGTLRWRGVATGATNTGSDGYVTIFGADYDASKAAPSNPMAVYIFGNDGRLGSTYGLSGGTRVFLPFTVNLPATSVVTDLISTYSAAAGRITDYMNGAQAAASTGGATGVFGYTATSFFAVGNDIANTTSTGNITTTLAALYNYEMPADLVAWSNREPYAMIRAVASRVFGNAVTVATQRPFLISW